MEPDRTDCMKGRVIPDFCRERETFVNNHRGAQWLILSYQTVLFVSSILFLFKCICRRNVTKCATLPSSIVKIKCRSVS